MFSLATDRDYVEATGFVSLVLGVAGIVLMRKAWQIARGAS